MPWTHALNAQARYTGTKTGTGPSGYAGDAAITAPTHPPFKWNLTYFETWSGRMASFS
jgi:hypothetical protein